MEVHKYQISDTNVQGQVIGDNNLIIQHFISGITRLPSDYASRIKNFLTEYLGTSDRPVPFGGRTEDISHLDTWLDSPNASSYMLLVAPAGRGKSALLVHWSQRLLARSDTEVIFFPVSIRFSTNLASVVFASITARLAILHDETVPSAPIRLCRYGED